MAKELITLNKISAGPRSKSAIHHGEQSFPQIFPSHQNDVIALQGVLELRTGHRVEVALPPRRAIRLMVDRDGFEFCIMVAGVNGVSRRQSAWPWDPFANAF